VLGRVLELSGPMPVLIDLISCLGVGGGVHRGFGAPTLAPQLLKWIAEPFPFAPWSKLRELLCRGFFFFAKWTDK
jgi:hypothetical protein